MSLNIEMSIKPVDLTYSVGQHKGVEFLLEAYDLIGWHNVPENGVSPQRILKLERNREERIVNISFTLSSGSWKFTWSMKFCW